jgi:hypothetical protein
MRPLISSVLALSFLFASVGCQSDDGDYAAVEENENGSQPINKKEEAEYKRAVLKCYKTGGTRVVKVVGKLRCY